MCHRDTLFPDTTAPAGLLHLYVAEIAGQVVDSYAAQILIPVDMGEDRPPHRHLAGAMSARWLLLTRDDSFNAHQRKRSAVARCDAGQVGRLHFEGLGHWTVTLRVGAMTGGAIGFGQGGPLYGIDQRRLFRSLLARTLRHGETPCQQHSTHSQTAQKSSVHDVSLYLSPGNWRTT